jgi:cyclic AMP-dependent transcription factor ATF-2
MDLNMAADVANFYTSSDIWCTSSNNIYAYDTTSHIEPSELSSTVLLEDQSAVASNTASANRDASLQHPSPIQHNTFSTMRHNQHNFTVSPLDTRFEPDEPSATSNNSSVFDAPQPSMSRIGEQQYNSSQHTSTAHGSMSSQTSHEPPSPTATSQYTRRRRRLENAEPGSARATYLEKNRTAASKCRTKQKRQQEELVEQAREQEIRNKCLKAEVEMLKGGIRELMDHIGQHHNCADARIRLYIQREADRLATGEPRTNPSSETSAVGGGLYLIRNPDDP